METQVEQSNLVLEHLNPGAEIESPNFTTYHVMNREGDKVIFSRNKVEKGRVVPEISVKSFEELSTESKEYRNMHGIDQPGYKGWTIRERSRKDIQTYCNFHGYSDCEPYEVVRVISDKTVEVRRMDTKQTVFPTFEVGGFSAHSSNDQDYEYISNPENRVSRVRWSERNKQWQGKSGRFVMNDHPIKHYDYNF